jgi:hypothetical protein
MRRVAYLTDVEGRWEKLEEFCSSNPLVELRDGRIRVGDGVFVFGGDAIDRGPSGRRLVATLTEAKRAQPDRIVLLAGNRDINKLRLVRELRGHPPARVPLDVIAKGQGALLSFILSETMGAKEALGHRCTELALEGRPDSIDDAAQSFLEDLAPTGALTQYLSQCVLAHREDETLFVHGGVTEENLGIVPGHPERAATVDAWTSRLNEFYAQSMDHFVARRLSETGAPRWAPLVEYQAPKRGTRLNQASVVYARPINARGDPTLPDAAVIRALRKDGIERVIVGHTPSGDCPAILRDDDHFELVLADNSMVVSKEGHVSSSTGAAFGSRARPSSIQVNGRPWISSSHEPSGARSADGTSDRASS